MGLQQEIPADTTLFDRDSIEVQEDKPTSVFIEEEPGDPAVYNIAKNINRDLTPDWILYFIIVVLIVLAWIRLIFSKTLVKVFKSALNYQLSLKLYDDPGLIQKRIFTFLNILYFLTTGVFIFLLLDFFLYYPLALGGLNLFLAVTTVLILYSLFRYFSMKFTGYLFNQQDLFSEARFHNFLYNKVSGILIIPFILLLAYTEGVLQEISAYAGLLLLFSIVIMRVFRFAVFLMKADFLIFYFILYLCTLEIVPLLVVIKLILSLS
jgi:hypothetical protein